jgi:hypothetical protein
VAAVLQPTLVDEVHVHRQTTVPEGLNTWARSSRGAAPRVTARSRSGSGKAQGTRHHRGARHGGAAPRVTARSRSEQSPPGQTSRCGSGANGNDEIRVSPTGITKYSSILLLLLLLILFIMFNRSSYSTYLFKYVIL